MGLVSSWASLWLAISFVSASVFVPAPLVGRSYFKLKDLLVDFCPYHSTLKGLGQTWKCVSWKHPGTNVFCLHGHFKMSLTFTGVYKYPQPLNHEAAVGMAFACLLLPASNDRKGLWQRRWGSTGKWSLQNSHVSSLQDTGFCIIRRGAMLTWYEFRAC